MTGEKDNYKDKSPEDKKEDDLLEEIRDNYESALETFKPSMDEGDKDIDFILNDGWPEAEKALRRKAGSERPMVSCDQLNQYSNLVINEVRQHPRQIKISPAGYGATAKLAEIRENRLRSIQYRSDAQASYLTAMENACQRSYGFARVILRYVSETSTDQEIIIQRVPNPNSVLFDPACREIDCSDADFCFVLENFTKTAFKRRWPNAEIMDFDGQMSSDYPQWIKDKHIQVAEYWKVIKTRDHLYIVTGDEGVERKMLESEFKNLNGGVEDGVIVIPPSEDMPTGGRFPVTGDRKTELKKIVQYITNGVETLETNEWIGKWIPIVPLFGKEVYSSNAGRSKKVLMSLIRNAREPQMAYNYFMTCALEAVGMVPRSTIKALEGSLEGHENEWQEAHHIPKAFLYYKPVQLPDGSWATEAPGSTPFDPPLQNLMIGVEAFLRAIQSAVGMYNTSVGKDDTNAKSGVAIKQLDAQSDQGAFHFIDNYNHRFLGAIGRICNDLISKVDAKPREITVRTKDNKDKLIWVNKPYTDENGENQHHDMTLGEYDITIGVEQTEDSQREAASNFLETFIQELAGMYGEDPAKKDALLALSIEAKQLGPIGEQMVKILQPTLGDPAQIQQQAQQLQAQVQQLSTENAALLQDKAARVMEQQTKIQIEDKKIAAKGSADAASHAIQMSESDKDRETKLAVAEVMTKAQNLSERLTAIETLMKQFHQQAHEAGIQATEHAHAKDLAAQQAQHTQDAATQAASLQPPAEEGQ